MPPLHTNLGAGTMLDDAWAFGGRAKASYRLAVEERIYEARYHNFCEGEHFWQAALRHAERSEDPGAMMDLSEDIESLREEALRAIQGSA